MHSDSPAHSAAESGTFAVGIDSSCQAVCGRSPSAPLESRVITGAHPMTPTTAVPTAPTTAPARSATTTRLGWSSHRRVVGAAPLLVAATLVTLPAVVATVSGDLSVTGLVAVFVAALSLTLLAAALGLRVVAVVDGPTAAVAGAAATRSTFPNHPSHPTADPTAEPSSTNGATLGRIAVARVPADQAIDGRAPVTPLHVPPIPPTSQDHDMHRSAPIQGVPR